MKKGNKGNPEGTLFPGSGHMAGNEMVGIDNAGYIDKKGAPLGAMLNELPPGMDIEKQKDSDIRALPLKTYGGGVGFPGDGW